jgi:hypothetical protein
MKKKTNKNQMLAGVFLLFIAPVGFYAVYVLDFLKPYRLWGFLICGGLVLLSIVLIATSKRKVKEVPVKETEGKDGIGLGKSVLLLLLVLGLLVLIVFVFDFLGFDIPIN